MSKLLLSVMGAFAEFERALIRERQLEGIEPGPAVLRDSGLGDEAGFLAVDQTMTFLDDPRIVGAGDATALSMPKLGHIAIHQADLAAATLRAQITGNGETPSYHPEVFCIMNRGGAEATLILSDTLYGGVRDIARSGPGPICSSGASTPGASTPAVISPRR